MGFAGSSHIMRFCWFFAGAAAFRRSGPFELRKLPMIDSFVPQSLRSQAPMILCGAWNEYAAQPLALRAAFKKL